MQLINWTFSIDNENFENITVPHTWNTDKRYQDLRQKCFYKTALFVEKISDFNILRFEASFHDTEVFINGVKAFEHFNSGYTPFEADVSEFIKPGDNEIFVTVDNSFSENCLPWKDQFDWNCDGGLIREVYFNQYKADEIKDIFAYTSSLRMHGAENASAYINIEVELFGKIKDKDVKIEIDNKSVILKTDRFGKCFTSIYCDDITVWSPENPCLYELKVNEKTIKFGFRTIETKGDRVCLNGREYLLKGLEWMPGSHPDYGMAEPREFAVKNLEMLKDIGCNFTRFHWQQPDFVYDWCDENGLMVQEEIPYWGSPKRATKQQLITAKQQSFEMFSAHKNHPSIVCWGVGNELGGGEGDTIRYVFESVRCFKSLDKTRLVNFVSNTLHRVENLDAAMFGDICMWNEYIGLWYPELSDIDAVLKDLVKRCKGKPFMITEAGLCEPAFDGGDKRRCEMYKEREKIYRANNLAGYRTHMGEYGQGRFKQRIHGSTNLYGDKKPSYEVLKNEISKPGK